MTSRIHTPPKLYIEEWMKTVPGLDRKRLAKRMGVSAGTITKKLARPENIDGEWLAMFAAALDRNDPTDLYRDPSGTEQKSPEGTLRSALLSFKVAPSSIAHVMAIIETFVPPEAKSEQTASHDQPQPSLRLHDVKPLK